MNEVNLYKGYNTLSDFSSDNIYTIFDSGQQLSRLAHQISWEQDSLYAKMFTLLLTDIHDNTIELVNNSDIKQIPNEVYYKTIAIKYNQYTEDFNEEVEETTGQYTVTPLNIGKVALKKLGDENAEIRYIMPEAIDLIVNNQGKIVAKIIINEVELFENEEEITEQEKSYEDGEYEVIGTLGTFTDNLEKSEAENFEEDIQINDLPGGIISYTEIEYSDFNTDIEEPVDNWTYFIENTQLQLFTIPAGVEFSDMVDSKYVYEYIDLFFTLDSPLNEEFVSFPEEKDIEENQLKINNECYVAKSTWQTAIPGSAIPYTASIVKGKNVRVDVYLRYWTAEPGVRV